LGSIEAISIPDRKPLCGSDLPDFSAVTKLAGGYCVTRFRELAVS
jgi:hypothetical protein